MVDYVILNKGAYYFLLVRAVVLAIETLYLLFKKRTDSDVLTNYTCGIIVYFCLKLLQNGAAYALILWFADFAPWQLENSWWVLILSIFAADLSFYIYHRTAHRIRLFWADHSVHHSSKEYDFTTNLRNSFISATYSWWPVLPMLLLGMPPGMMMWSRTLVNDYTFFLHTNYVYKLGWLEHIFVTPSHHRVHHSTNPQYIHKKFAFMFIFWDKLFGTFAEEKEPCEFGVRNPPPTKNPFTAMFYEWRCMLTDVYRAPGWQNKLRVFGRM